jgi:hypothetical protein
MTWKKLTVLGLVGAAIAVPIIRRKMNKGGYAAKTDTFGSLESDSVGNMGGGSAPASETWAQGGSQ